MSCWYFTNLQLLGYKRLMFEGKLSEKEIWYQRSQTHYKFFTGQGKRILAMVDIVESPLFNTTKLNFFSMCHAFSQKYRITSFEGIYRTIIVRKDLARLICPSCAYWEYKFEPTTQSYIVKSAFVCAWMYSTLRTTEKERAAYAVRIVEGNNLFRVLPQYEQGISTQAPSPNRLLFYTCEFIRDHSNTGHLSMNLFNHNHKLAPLDGGRCWEGFQIGELTRFQTSPFGQG